MDLECVIADVFAEEQFGGNQLAVVFEADGLSTETMQQIAAEFTYSETAFVLAPPDDEHDATVRIFTPKAELPFAGHPSIGAAVSLAHRSGMAGHTIRLRLAERAGSIEAVVAKSSAEVRAPLPWQALSELSTAEVAAASGLAETDFDTAEHPPLVATCGTAFAVARVQDEATLDRAAPQAAPVLGQARGLLLYTATGPLRARMFAPDLGVPEDPATGSAAVVLAGLLAEEQGPGQWVIEQGRSVGRPSVLRVRAEPGEDGWNCFVAGRSIPFVNGTVHLNGI